MNRLLVCVAAVVPTVALIAACSDTPAPEVVGTPLLPASACTDALDSIYADPGTLEKGVAGRGKVLRCAKEVTLDVATVNARLKLLGDKGKPATSGITVYKVLFQTERGDSANSVGYSSARVFVPTTPRLGKLPAVVTASGTRGQNGKCAASKSPLELGVDDALKMAMPIAAAGLPVIMPDLAGYANYGAAGNPPSGYALADDVGRSVLDATRALHQMFPMLADTSVLVGHSQGGHSALSGLALAESYGAPDVKVAGAAVHAPLWLSQRTWGAIMNSDVATRFDIKASSFTAAVTVWYHYSHAEVLDGPGEGLKMFKPEVRDGVKAWFDTKCIQDGSAELGKLGTYIHEGYDPTFVAAVKFSSTLPFTPPGEAGSLSAKWMNRYLNDRPHLTGKAATTPILITYGGQDTTIPKERMACAIERLTEDAAKYRVCYNPTATHSTIVNETGSYVADWIYQKTNGGADPGKCPGDEAAAALPACATPPPND
jgi:pimeloyl-ACP methyl ester carboxylesterase